MRTATDRDRVLADLQAAGLRGICAAHWYRSALPNARNRVGELRRAGWCIRSFPCGDDHDAPYYKYVLLHERARSCGACRPVQLTLAAAVAP